jgi:hypothetical protein
VSEQPPATDKPWQLWNADGKLIGEFATEEAAIENREALCGLNQRDDYKIKKQPPVTATCTCHLPEQTECPLHGTGWPQLPQQPPVAQPQRIEDMTHDKGCYYWTDRTRCTCGAWKQPPATEQEWTPEYVRKIGAHYSIIQQRDKAIADAHNAAIATERQATSNAFQKGYDQGHADATAAERGF